MQKFTGKQYLAMDIAGSYGLDNKDWDVRLAWFEEHKHDLMSMMQTAKEPALFFAGVKAWEDTMAGKPSGYPISLDATCSGMQILACLTGDEMAAKLCNVVGVGHRADAYTSLYQSMLNHLGQTGLITRAKTKEAILTSLYGSQAIPKQVFGEGILLTTFHNTMESETPAVWELNKTYLAIWDPERLVYKWTLPDNFHVQITVMGQITESVMFDNQPFEVSTMVNMPVEEGRSLGANTTHSVDGMIVREMIRRCNYNPSQVAKVKGYLHDCEAHDTGADDYDSEMVRILWDHYKESGYLSARILNHIHLDNAGIVDYSTVLELINSLPAKPFEVIAIHDCFRCLPNYGDDLRMQYNRQLFEIARSNLLSSLFTQLLGHKADIGKMVPDMYTRILDADYALC
jgi:hypothetical protein